MTKEFLTQDEVDTLLKGAGDVEDGTEDVPGDQAVKPYNLATQERIVRGRMPALDIVNEQFARLLRTGLFNFMRRSAEISVGPVKAQKYGEFIRNLVQPTNLNLVQVKPLRGTGLFVFDPNLVSLVVDNLFGGDGRFQTRAEGREFTQTEHRIIQRLLEVVFECYERAWKPVFEVKFEYLRAESNVQFVNIATPNEVVISTTFTVEFGSASADLHICLPYAMLEPIRDVLNSRLQGDQIEPDRRWVRLLSKQVQSAQVELVADLGSTSLSLGEIMRLKIGDVIPLEIPGTLNAAVDGVQVMECQYGIFNGQYALRVLNMINHGQQDAASERHSSERNG